MGVVEENKRRALLRMNKLSLYVMFRLKRTDRVFGTKALLMGSHVLAMCTNMG